MSAEDVKEIQELSAETNLDECEKTDLWEFAKAHGLVEPSTYQRTTTAQLRETVRDYFEASTARVREVWGKGDFAVWTGNPARLPRISDRVEQGVVYSRSEWGDERFDRFIQLPQVEVVEDPDA